MFLQNKVILKMLKTKPLLKNFTSNQINGLVEKGETRDFCQHQVIMKEG